MTYAYCSSKDCKYSELFGAINDFGDIKRAAKFCPKCGSAIITACPHCNTLRQSMDDIFCRECGKQYGE